MIFWNELRERIQLTSLTDALADVHFSKGLLLKVGAYCAFGLIVFCMVFTLQYWTVKADGLTNEMLSDVNGMRVEVAGLTPQFLPPGAMISRLNVFDAQSGKKLFLLHDVELRLSTLPLLVGKIDLGMVGRAYNGMANLTLEFGSLFDFDWVNFDIQLDMVELDAIPQVLEYDRTMTGFGSFEAFLEGLWAEPKGLTGIVKVSLDKVDMDNKFPLIRAKRLKECSVDMKFSLTDGVLAAEFFRVQGEGGITLTAGGAIVVNERDFKQSTLKMQGKIIGPNKAVMQDAFRAKALQKLEKGRDVLISFLGSIKSPQIVLR